MPRAGNSPRGRALAHYGWARRYDRDDADPARASAHLGRAMHYMRLSETRFGVGSEVTDIPDTVMIGPGGNESWFAAKPVQTQIVDTLIDSERGGPGTGTVHFTDGQRNGVVMSCHRSAQTGGIYILSYSVGQAHESDETVRSTVLESIQKNNSGGLGGVSTSIRVVEDWRKDRLRIELDGAWHDARPYQKFAYFDFMLRTKGSGDKVVYRNQMHVNYSEGPADSIVIPPVYSANDIMLTMERDKADSAAIYMNTVDGRRLRMSDSPLVHAPRASEKRKRAADTPDAVGVIPLAILKNVDTIAASRAKLVQLMNEVYEVGYGPPAWAGVSYVDDFKAYAHKAMLFVDEGAPVDLVRRLACEREPVNIAMTPHFNKNKMKAHFGYETSLYGRHHAVTGGLAPNIGVLTRCKVEVQGKYQDATVYHAIGAALDNESQADYQYFMPGGKPRVAELIAFYVSVFEKIFFAARRCNAPGIVMSLVGAAAFAQLYPGTARKMQREVWIPAFRRVRQRHPLVKLAAMGDIDNPAGEYLMGEAKAVRAINYPGLLPAYPDWMIVNAWDCHTLPGNGNRLDPTLDGYVGRTSAIHYFGWGFANPHLLKNMVMVPRAAVADEDDDDDDLVFIAETTPAQAHAAARIKAKRDGNFVDLSD